MRLCVQLHDQAKVESASNGSMGQTEGNIRNEVGDLESEMKSLGINAKLAVDSPMEMFDRPSLVILSAYSSMAGPCLISPVPSGLTNLPEALGVAMQQHR